MAHETKGVMAFDELQQSPEYAACSDKMKLWLQTLISSDFNYKLATATAYNCKNLRQAHVFSYAVRKWPVIRAALNLYLGRSEQDVFLEDLKETIRRSPVGSDRHVRAQALYARLKFGVSESSAEPEAEPVPVIPDSRVPTDHLEVWSDPKTGVVIGYRAANGDAVKLS